MTRISRVASAAVALTFAVLAVTVSAPPASASAPADDGDGSVTWSVQPADANGPDGRSWIELSLDPGETVVEHLALRNLSDTAETFAIKAADGYLTPTRRFNMLPSDTPSVDAGTWVSAPASVELGSGGMSVVDFTVTVPENATPGDHAAGIAATVQSVGTGNDGNHVAIESRVGFPVMIRVTGELHPSVTVEPVSTTYELSWNPFAPGRVTVVYRLVNDGNVRVQASATVQAQGSAADGAEDSVELLPGDAREVTASVPGVWPSVVVPVTVSVEPTMVSPDGDPKRLDVITADFVVWAIPLSQLLVVLGIVLVIIALWAGRRRSRRRLVTAVAEAHEAGRLSASS